MQTVIIILVGLTFAVVLTGFGIMIAGGNTNERFGTKLMALRVALQASVILLLAVLAMSAA